MKTYLKIFWSMGIRFGLVMGVLAGWAIDVQTGIKYGAFYGLCFGLVMSLCLGTLQRLNTRKMAGGEITPSQSTSVELGSDLHTAFAQCIQALNQLGAKIQSQDKDKLEIKATSRMTWKSWGETLIVRLSAGANGTSRIEISSSPRLKNTIVDYGKGRQNVERLAKILTGEN